MFIAPLVWLALGQVPATPLTGTVVGPGGEPVVGAELILVGLPSYDPPIVARGKSGEGGRFSLERPTGLAGDHHPQRAPILWAVKPGLRASTTRFPEALPKPDEPVRIVLEPPGKAEVRVVGPDGQPLGGVKVFPERLKTHYTTVPDVVADLAAARTGLDGLRRHRCGRARGADIRRRSFARVRHPGTPDRLQARQAGGDRASAGFDLERASNGPRPHARPRLASPGLDPGRSRTRAPSPRRPATLRRRPTIRADSPSPRSPSAGSSSTLSRRASSRSWPTCRDSLIVREGREDSVDIPLKSTVTVTGLFLERGTAQARAGHLGHADLSRRKSERQPDRQDRRNGTLYLP